MDQARLAQALAGRYEIEGPIGSGGTAAVFRATDLKHHRTVAIKVLHPEIANSIGPARFLAEIETAARLNHPHILPLYDSGDAGGYLYYVMPYIVGDSLRQMIARERMLSLDSALRIACEVGEALEYAHRQGRVHRDIKPENIMISEGHALVADFGLAKATDPVDPSIATTVGTVMGTPAYMSPEQWSGVTATLDARTDIYSLACTLYEMLGGQPPFTGATAQSIAHQHLNTEPRPLTALRPSVPEAVVHAISRGLAKVAADRPASMAAFVTALREAMAAGDASPGPSSTRRPPAPKRAPFVAGGIALLVVLSALAGWWVLAHRTSDRADNNSIAVLPLRGLSTDQNMAYFADGMTDELVTCLSKISSLTVISSSATSGYRDTKKPLQRVAQELGVRFVLEGSVARDLGKVRIGTRLIEASTGKNLWGESYERGAQDVFAIQSDVALAVARQIQARLTPEERAAISAPLRVDPEAHELLLKARFSIDPSTREGAQRSIQLLKQALARDPNYAMAYAELGNTYYFMSGWYLPAHEAMPLARQYAERALGIDPRQTEGMTIRGLVTALYDWRFAEGLTQLRGAVESNPGSVLAHQWYGYTLNQVGRFSDARAEFARARALDPISLQLHWFMIWPDFYERRYADAVAALNTLRAEDESFWPTLSLLGETYEQQGDLPRALTTLEHAREQGGNPWVAAAIARVLAKMGREADARRTLHQLEAQRESTYIQPYALATVHAYLHEPDQAFAELERCYRDQSEDITFLPIDPRVDVLRKDRRFAALVARLGDLSKIGPSAAGPMSVGCTHPRRPSTWARTRARSSAAG